MNVKALSKGLNIIIIAFIVLEAVITVVTLLALVIPEQFDGKTIGIPVPFESYIEGRLETPNRSLKAVVKGGTAKIAVGLSSRPVLLGTWFVITAALGAAAWITRQIKLIFDAAAAGKPFAHETVQRIRKIAFAVFIFGGGRFLVAVVVALAAEAWLLIPGMSAMLRLDNLLGFIATGAVILGFAEIFRYGLSLQEEQDLTV